MQGRGIVKAGVVVGVAIILLALAIFWIANGVNKDKEGENTASKAVESSEKAEGVSKATTSEEKPATSQKKTEESKPSKVQETPSKVATSASNGNTSAGEHVFSTIDYDDMGEPVKNRTEIMVISNKKVVLMDSSYGTTEGKQLVYAVDLLYGEGVMTLYMNGQSFEELKVGDKLKVEYDMYTNNKGVLFPVILNAEKD